MLLSAGLRVMRIAGIRCSAGRRILDGQPRGLSCSHGVPWHMHGGTGPFRHGEAALRVLDAGLRDAGFRGDTTAMERGVWRLEPQPVPGMR